MKAKRIILNLLFLATGLVAGWFLFKNEKTQNHQHITSSAQQYTCSMHPQIRQNEPGKCPLCGMDLIPVSSATDEGNPYIHQLSESDVVAAGIRTTKVRRASASAEITLTGKIQINEEKLTVITAKFPGRIEKLYINAEGQMIQAGDKLALIYSPELITAQRELLEAKKLTQVSPELYRAAREKLRLWKITDRQIDAIEAANQVTQLFEIHSDVSGVITRRLVNAGDYVSTGSPMLEVAGLSSVWVILDAYETDLPWIQRGATLQFTTPALPGQNFTAVVQLINPVINEQTRTAQVRAEINNAGMQLKPEMLVNATLRTKLPGKADALVIPASSVLWTGKRSVVYVKSDDGLTFEMREITLGPKMNNLYIVESGLDEGEEVVSEGTFAVDASAQLTGSYSMMNRPAEKNSNAPLKFREQLSGVLSAYYVVKNALVASDKNNASGGANSVLMALKSVSHKLQDEEADKTWQKIKSNIEKYALIIQKAKTLEEQREAFEGLSNALIEAVEKFGLRSGKAWKAYCPMAFDDKGAYWLSEFEEIKNPYFGASMLRCGINKEVFR